MKTIRKVVRKMGDQNERIFAAAIYITSFFSTFVGPLIIWLLKKDDSSLVDFHGREYLNFLISYTIYLIGAGVLCIVLIGFLLLPVIGLLMTIFTIIGAIKAFDGQAYKIPFTIQFLKTV
ncbi:DUF4870 domain-containing protein [Lederbergia panacisoli]|uniref:DUF4870 domain-containing protein n=1 Tax=Lederbergia panacisoli TaxID=1255251 RepID=UPI00214C13F1|nr:DUF4870 domain-containing protein [Lederbergia panacisoli]MCR2820152.1 DUF4870 domain-containing protein [Lederbergia panacisoli]